MRRMIGVFWEKHLPLVFEPNTDLRHLVSAINIVSLSRSFEEVGVDALLEMRFYEATDVSEEYCTPKLASMCTWRTNVAASPYKLAFAFEQIQLQTRALELQHVLTFSRTAVRLGIDRKKVAGSSDQVKEHVMSVETG